MKNTSAIINDLLAIIERQEKALELSTKLAISTAVEIENLKISLIESSRTNYILTEVARKLLDNGDTIAKAIINLNQEMIQTNSKKRDALGGKSFPLSNN